MKKLLTKILLAALLAGFAAYFIVGIATRVREENLGQENLGAIDIFTEVKMEGWGSGWFTAPEFDGDNMPIDALVEASNLEFNVKKSIAPRRGTMILGTQSTETSPVQSMHTSKALDGRELLVRTSTTTMEWWNADDSDWDILDTGYTNNQQFTFADGMTSSETAMYTYFANGAESLRRFRIAFGSVASASSTAVTLNSVDGFDSADDIGFDTTGTVTVDGTNYSYTGFTGWELTGMTGVPSLSANEGVISQVETSGFTDTPTTTVAIVIKDQRLYAAYQNSVFCSNIDDFQDFSFSSPRIASEGEIIIFPEGGRSIDALGVREEYVAVFKKDFIGKLEFKDFGADFSDIPVLSTVDRGPNIGAPNQAAVTNRKNGVMYSSRELGITELSRIGDQNFDSITRITDRIKPSVEDYSFSDSDIIYFDDRILNSANDDSGFNNKILIYDVVFDRLTEFEGINADSFAVYNDKLYYGDSITKNVYQMFYEEYTDNNLPYTTEWKTKWINFGAPANWKELGYVFVEGFINTATEITFTILLDEGGKLTEADYLISGTGDYVSQGDTSGFGINPFGLMNFSNIEGDSSNLKHFAGFINTDDLFPFKFRNIQFKGKTSGSDQNFRINKIIPYVNILDKQWGMDYSEMIIND